MNTVRQMDAFKIRKLNTEEIHWNHCYLWELTEDPGIQIPLKTQAHILLFYLAPPSAFFSKEKTLQLITSEVNSQLLNWQHKLSHEWKIWTIIFKCWDFKGTNTAQSIDSRHTTLSSKMTLARVNYWYTGLSLDLQIREKFCHILQNYREVCNLQHFFPI
jgi:hypothetical protein